MIEFPNRRIAKLLVVSVLWALLTGNTIFAQQAPAAVVPSGFWEGLVIGGFTRPTAMAFAPDGRLFVALQDGDLRVIQNGVLLPTPFLHVDLSANGERGLLGIAFDPHFAINKYVYIYYTTATDPIHNRISRFTANGNVAVPNSEVVIFDLDPMTGLNHNGGAIHFGPDGKLYAGVGDSSAPFNAQLLTNLHGKILRINKDGSVPTDNPFYNQASGNNRAIWAIGLRNPFTFAFQPGTGRMFINDVGENTWEEINDGIPGANYGWPETEGPTDDPDYQSPIYAYRHDGVGTDGGCSINGGAFYNPVNVQFPAEYVGDYFFGDFCRRWIRHFDLTTETASLFVTETAPFLVDIKTGIDGNLYYLSRGNSSTPAGVYRIEYLTCPPPANPSPDGAAPQRGHFTSLPVTLTWNRVSWAQGYQIQVDNTSDFRPVTYTVEVTADTLSANLDNLIDCTYYWRVRAKINDTTWGPWTAVQQFRLDLP
jgi:glucose/arabinose dehydrogenase